MTIIFRASDQFMSDVRRDLVRAHPYADERVGFITVRASHARNAILVLAEDYSPVVDSDYVYDTSVGAMIGQEAFRKALEIALLRKVGIFHVHMHLFPARLWFSRTDLREQEKFVPDFFKVRPEMPHGALVLSPYTAAGRVWLAKDRIENFSEFNVIGRQVKISRAAANGSADFYT